MNTASRFAVVAKALIRPALWFCASNLIAAVLSAQCANVSQVPNQTISSGTNCYSNNDTLTAAGVTINGSASVTFVGGHTVHLAPGFRATAGTAGTTFHAWVEAAPSVVSFAPSGSSGLSQPFTITTSSPAGSSNLSEVYALFNTSESGANACYIRYNRNANLLYLADNAASNWSSGFTPGSSGIASNSYCSISGVGASVNAAGTQLAVTVPVTFQASFSGVKNEYVKVYDQYGLYTEWQPMGTWTVGGGTGFTPIRISSGGPYTDTLGQYWAADYGFQQSLGTWSTTAAISVTSDPRLYQTERYNYPGSLTYQFPVPNGNYTVTLKFAEIYDSAPGQRYQNIALNGTTVVTGLDVWIAAGGPNRAYDLSLPVSVTNGQLTIALTCTSPNNSAEVNSIQIVSAGTGGSVPSAANSLATATPTSVLADGSATSTITVTLRDSGNIPVSGKTVVLSQGAGHSTISPASGISNASGIVTFAARDATVETVTFTATDTTDSVTVTQAPSVSFTASPPPLTSVTLATAPSGLYVTVDGAGCYSPCPYQWAPGSNHTISTTAAQSGGGSQYLFSYWSDGKPLTHVITVGSTATITATFGARIPVSGGISPSPVEVNLGPAPIDAFDGITLNYSSLCDDGVCFPSCPSYITTAQACMQFFLSKYAIQGVSGVRFQFYLRTEPSKAFCTSADPPSCRYDPNCNYPNGCVRSQWVANLRNFFQDLYSFGMLKITPTPSLDDFGGVNLSGPTCAPYLSVPTGPDPNTQNLCPTLGKCPNPLCGDTQSDDDQLCRQLNPTCPTQASGCTTTLNGQSVLGKYLKFSPLTPYGFDPRADDNVDGAKDTGNQAYYCSPANSTFWGWDKMRALISAIAQQTAEAGLTIEEFDLTNEVNLAYSTAAARLIYDNTPDPVSGTMTPVFRYLGQALPVPSVLTVSVNTDVPENFSGPAYNPYPCRSVYGDKAHVLGSSELLAATGAH